MWLSVLQGSDSVTGQGTPLSRGPQVFNVVGQHVIKGAHGFRQLKVVIMSKVGIKLLSSSLVTLASLWLYG